jgi:hypothetical protein
MRRPREGVVEGVGRTREAVLLEEPLGLLLARGGGRVRSADAERLLSALGDLVPAAADLEALPDLPELPLM